MTAYVRESTVSTRTAGNHESHDRDHQRLVDSRYLQCMVTQAPLIPTMIKRTRDDVLLSSMSVSVGRSRASCYSIAQSASVVAIESKNYTVEDGNRTDPGLYRRRRYYSPSLCCCCCRCCIEAVMGLLLTASLGLVVVWKYFV